MSAWNFPSFIILAAGVALAFYWALTRAARAPRLPDFECVVCGRKQLHPDSKSWRYCPYCGAPHNARELAKIARRMGA
jgi:hypothetical protein